MLCRFRNYLLRIYSETKRLIKCYKWIAITALVCAFIGLIMAFSKGEALSERYSDGNMITQVSAKSFNCLTFYIKSILIVSGIGIITFLLTINFYTFLLNFILIIFYVKTYLGYMFVSCILDGVTGYLLLFLVWIPLLIFNLLLLIILMIRLFELIDYPCNYRKACRIIPYKSYWRGTKKILSRHLILSNIATFTYLSIVIIIISLIF